MYFPRNWEFGSALSKLRNSGGGGGWTPNSPAPRYATVCNWQTDPQGKYILSTESNNHLDWSTLVRKKVSNFFASIYAFIMPADLNHQHSCENVKRSTDKWVVSLHVPLRCGISSTADRSQQMAELASCSTPWGMCFICVCADICTNPKISSYKPHTCLSERFNPPFPNYRLCILCGCAL
jgi:hypothetical protein